MSTKRLSAGFRLQLINNALEILRENKARDLEGISHVQTVSLRPGEPVSVLNRCDCKACVIERKYAQLAQDIGKGQRLAMRELAERELYKLEAFDKKRHRGKPKCTEKEIRQAFAQGGTIQEIANRLHVSLRTATNYKKKFAQR